MEGTVHLTHGLALSCEKYAKVFGSSMMSMKTQMCVQTKWRGPQDLFRSMSVEHRENFTQSLIFAEYYG